MGISIDHHVHYRCVFTLIPKADAGAKWNDIPYAIRRWIGNRASQNQGFQGKWYFAGGQWRPAGDKRFLVQTGRCIGNGSDDSPQYWAVRYEHACDTASARQWRTDIGLTLGTDDSVTISLLTIHWLQPGFIGKEPDSPQPSAPGIIGALLRDQKWSAFADSEPLAQTVKPLNAGQAHIFRDRILDRNRGVPAVLVSKSFHSGNPMIDAPQLARLLAGTATVYESETSLVDKELEYLLDPDYRCWNGMVRVYQTGLNPNRPGDSRRHRYFSADDIAALGPAAVLDLLVRGIVRRPLPRTDSGVANVEDVQAKVQQEHLAALKASGPSKDAWIAALEADNTILSEKLVDSQKEVSEWAAEADRLQTVDDENGVLTYRNKALSEETAKAKERAALFEKQAAVLLGLEDFPESVSDVITLVERVFPGRVFFTDRSKSDAAKCKLRDPSAAWRCLRSMATHLHKLHFEDKLPMREISKQFENLVSFELATTESETTRNNKKLAQQRKSIYKGKETDFSPHVKFGRDPGNSLRVHYFADNEDRVIVIDRCGDHLDLMSTN